MRLVIRGHPAERMAERGVTREDIEHCVARHHSTWPGQAGSTAYVGPGTNGEDLIVWTLPGRAGSEVLIIKSVAWRDER